MEKKLVEVSEQEVRIDFALNCKCRANVRLTSLSATTPIAFKIQTSSPHKFLVKPPTGLIPPLCHVTFQVILKPQAHLPPAYPRSPSDRFLIKTAEFAAQSAHSESISHWFSSYSSTHDVKLKVAFVGPFLLRHAVTNRDYDAVRNIIKRRRTILAELTHTEAESLLRIATELVDPENMINLLLEAGLRIEPRVGSDEVIYESKGCDEQHVAAVCDRLDYGLGLRETESLECRDNGASIKCARVMAKSSAETNDGGVICADPTITNDHSHSIHDVALDKKKLEMGEQVLMAARRGDLKHVELLLQKGGYINYCDQYGLTALHAAAIKGHKDVARMLIEFGLDSECQDIEGHAPLHLAVVGGSLKIVEMLIQNGANVNARSKSGVTPLYMATAMGYEDITEFLISRGG